MLYAELPSVAVLAADFPSSFWVSGAQGPTPASVLERLAGDAASSGGGEVAKVLGDNIVLRFPEPAGAVKAAFFLLSGGTQVGWPPSGRPRVGLHLASARLVDGELLGPALDGASLLKALAEPGTAVASGELVHASLASGLFSPSPLPSSRQTSLPSGMLGYLLGPATQGPTAEGRPAASALLSEIRKAIMEDTKAAGRRLSVAEAKEKYGWYGPEAMEVIASLAEAGILLRSRPASREQEAGPRAARSAAELRADDVGKSIENAVHSIVSEIERSVVEHSRQGSRGFDREEFRAAMRRGKEELKAEIRLAKHQGRAERKAHRHGNSEVGEPGDFARYRTDLRTRARKFRVGVIPAVLSFAVVNAGLWYVYGQNPIGFPWAPLVSIFWGAGVLETLIGVFRSSRLAAEAEALPDLDAPATSELKALNKERESIGKHFVNTLSIPAALTILTPVLWPGQSWPLIVSAVLAGTFLIHLVGYLSTMPGKLRKFFASAGLPKGRKAQAEARRRRQSEPKDLGAYTEAYEEARASAAAIASSLGTEDPSSLNELKPQMDAYLDQILLLAKTANELDVIIGEIPMSDLASDKAELLAKAREAGEGLKSEYLKSVAEIEKQQESFKALQEQREVIDLRLKSSVNQLGQLKLDLARARAADREDEASRGEAAISSLRAKSLELSKYIEDLRTSRLDAIVDPFAELEKKYGDEVPRDKGAAESPGHDRSAS